MARACSIPATRLQGNACKCEENECAQVSQGTVTGHRHPAPPQRFRVVTAPPRYLLTLALAVVLLAAIAVFGGDEPAEAHTVTRHRCAMNANAHHFHRVQQWRFVFRRCLRWAPRHHWWHATHHGPRGAIRRAFPKRHHEALRVALCESTLRTTARNGQYVGLFQMGDWERANYGVGQYRTTNRDRAARATASEQARSARRYFDATGRDWDAWACKP